MFFTDFYLYWALNPFAAWRTEWMVPFHDARLYFLYVYVFSMKYKCSCFVLLTLLLTHDEQRRKSSACHLFLLLALVGTTTGWMKYLLALAWEGRTWVTVVLRMWVTVGLIACSRWRAWGSYRTGVGLPISLSEPYMSLTGVWRSALHRAILHRLRQVPACMPGRGFRFSYSPPQGGGLDEHCGKC